MRKKPKSIIPNKKRVASYIDNKMWEAITRIAEDDLATESHIMRILMHEALEARGEL